MAILKLISVHLQAFFYLINVNLNSYTCLLVINNDWKKLLYTYFLTLLQKKKKN